MEEIVMAGQEIDKLIVWTHPLYTSIYVGKNEIELKGWQARVALRRLRKEMEKEVAAMASRPETAMVLVEPTLGKALPGAKWEYQVFKRFCKKAFGDNRLAVLPTGVGYEGISHSKKNLEEKIGKFGFSREKLRVYRLGEYRDGCVLTANNRVVLAIESAHGIRVPAGRQHEIKKYSYRGNDAIKAILERVPRRPRLPSRTRKRGKPKRKYA